MKFIRTSFAPLTGYCIFKTADLKDSCPPEKDNIIPEPHCGAYSPFIAIIESTK